MQSIDNLDLQIIASQLAQFLNELNKIDVKGGPNPGLHNFWGGDHVSVYDTEVRSAIKECKVLLMLAL